jgi:three-Cys-motif partner protein
MDTLWQLEPATAAKHKLYKKYLDAWWPILLQPTRTGYSRPRVTYVDAFAGPGRYLDGEEGSPVFALERLLSHDAVGRMNLTRERVCLVFMEKEVQRYEYLKAELVRKFGNLDTLPVRVEVRRGAAGTDLDGVLGDVSAWGNPILAILDSWGNVNVPLPVVRRIATNPSSELITTFGPNWFNRRENLNPEQLDAVFGGREYWTPAHRESRPDERWRAWLSTYRDALRRAGCLHRLQFEVVPKTGLPLYLVFGTCAEKGVEVMKDAMWKVDGSGGLVFRDPRTRGAVNPDQPDLWGGSGYTEPELIELVTQRLQQGAVTIEELGKWLLLETSRWRARDARGAILELRATGSVSVAPTGQRVTKKSVVRLF